MTFFVLPLEFGREQYAEVFIRLRNAGHEEGRKLDRARHRLTHWYSRVQYMNKFGYLTDEEILTFPGASRAAYFVDIVEPLEFISRTTTGRDMYELFSWLRTKFNLGPSLITEKLKSRYRKLMSMKKYKGPDRFREVEGFTDSTFTTPNLYFEGAEAEPLESPAGTYIIPSSKSKDYSVASTQPETPGRKDEL